MKLNIVIPMAGNGQRFKDLGYKESKPFIKIGSKYMVQWAIESLGLSDAHFIFVMLNSDYNKYINIFNTFRPLNSTIVTIDEITEGAACTVLEVKDFIDNNTSLIVTNCDQFLTWNPHDFLMKSIGSDGLLQVYKDKSKDGAFCLLDDDDYVTKVAEKEVISDIAQTGVYYWSKGSDFVKYVQQMIDKNIRTNNEFYVGNVYNQAIEDGKKIKVHYMQPNEKLWRTGVVRELLHFYQEYIYKYDNPRTNS